MRANLISAAVFVFLFTLSACETSPIENQRSRINSQSSSKKVDLKPKKPKTTDKDTARKTKSEELQNIDPKSIVVSGSFIFKKTDASAFNLASENRIESAKSGLNILKNEIGASYVISTPSSSHEAALKDVTYFNVRISNPFTAEQTLELIKKLKKRGIEVEPNYIAKTQSLNDTYAPPSSGAWNQNFEDLWGLKRVGAEDAWTKSTGSGAIVAVIDTGVDPHHEDIAGQVIQGYDFVNSDNNAMDDHGHGTHVAGTIAAIANNGIGIAGVAPGAQIMPIKVLSSAGSGSFYNIALAIRYAADNGAHVINMSLGGRVSRSDVPSYYQDAIKHAYDKGVTIVVAAGNDSIDPIYFSPANDPRVITVSAADHSDNLAGFSNRGDIISISAPGGGYGAPRERSQYTVLSLLSSQAGYKGSEYQVGDNYLRLAGTSMAAPHVAAVAALVVSENPSFTPAQVQQALYQGADDIGEAGYDRNFGAGMVRADKAVNVSSPLHVQITEASISAWDGDEVEVEGVAYGDDLKDWRIEVKLSNGQWRKVLESTEAKQGLLGKFDHYDNGAETRHALRLIARNQADREFVDYYVYQSKGSALQWKYHPVINFGQVPAGTTTTILKSIRNETDIPITLNGAVFRDDLGVSFTGGSYPGIKGTCQDSLLGYASCDIEIEFTTKIAEEYAFITDYLEFTYTRLGKKLILSTPVYVLPTGPAALITFDHRTDSLYFGSVSYLQQTQKLITIKNEGSATAEIDSAYIDTDEHGFEILENRCGNLLEAGESCYYLVKFSNTFKDVDLIKRDVFRVRYSSGGNIVSVGLELKAEVATPRSYIKIVARTSAIVGRVKLGDVFTKDLEIWNYTGNGSLTANDLEFSFQDSTMMGVENIDCENDLQPDERCTIRITMSTDENTEIKTHYDNLWISYKNYGEAGTKIFLHAIIVEDAPARLELSSPNIDFGEVEQGQKVFSTLTVTNTSIKEATNIQFDTWIANSFDNEQSTCSSLLSGETCEITLSFEAAADADLGEVTSLPLFKYNDGFVTKHAYVELSATVVPAVVEPSNPWQNLINQFDVNNNGEVTSLDALLIINRIGVYGDFLPEENDTGVFYDVNGDGKLTSLDALQVINEAGRLDD